MVVSALGAQAPATSLRGILLMMSATVMFACLDTTAKFLAQTLPPTEVAFLRYVAHCVLLLLVVRAWSNRALFHPHSYRMQLLRGLALLGATGFNFAALKYLPLAEATSIMFAGPLLVTALAGPLLGEWAGVRRWMAIGVGFLGVLIVTRPGFGAMHWAVALSLCAMVSYAFYAIMTRRLGSSESAQGLLLWSGFVGAGGMAPLALPVFVVPEPAAWLLVALMGVFGLVGHCAMILAHKTAPAPLLAPYMYTQMIWVMITGLMVFGDLPDAWTVVGTLVIAGSGLYILHRERVRGSVPGTADPPVR